MAKTNWQDPRTSEIRSTHISGLQEAVKKIEETVDIYTTSETDIPLTEVFISNDDRCRIYQAPEGKRNWLSSPAPVIKKNGVVISEDFEIDYGGGAVIFTTPITESDSVTADATYITNQSTLSNNMLVAKAPIGFPNRTDSTFSFDKTTRTFTIQPTGSSYEVYYINKRFVKTEPESVVIPDVTGLYYIFFDKDTGELTASTNFPGLDNMIYISYVYWNAAQTNDALQFGPGDERHSTIMDKATHQRLHTIDWTQWVSGLQLYGYTLNDSSNNDAVKVSLTNGFVADEDLQHYIAHSSSPSSFYEQVLQDFAMIPVMYRDGVSGEWKQDVATEYPFKNFGSGLIAFNQLYEGSWKQTQVGSGQFVAYYIVFTSDVEQPIKVIQGQRTDNSLASAQANNDDRDIQWGNIPFQEMKVLYRLIYETNDSFTNERKACLRDVLDLRAARRSPGGGGIIPSAHSNLTGLDYASSGHIGFVSEVEFNAHKADSAAHGAHKNILINYDFRRPVNQRGSTSYAVRTSPTYTIDRWRAVSAGSGTVTVNSGYITIQSIYGETYIEQAIDDYNLYKGKTVTFSAKVNGLSGSGQAYILIYDGVSESRLNIASNGYVSITKTISASASTLLARVAAYSEYSANFECVKLEMGYFSTLEGDPPANYGEQLALCQRYFVAVNAFGIAYATPAFAIASSNTTARALLHLPAPMRLANPTVTMKGSNWVLTQTTPGAGLSVTAMTVASNESAANVGAIMLELTSSGLTTGSAYRLEAKADATCDIWISAEI